MSKIWGPLYNGSQSYQCKWFAGQKVQSECYDEESLNLVVVEEKDEGHEAAAKWMVEELKEQGTLYQSEAVWEIQSRFGEELVYCNANGNEAIDKKVLKEFRKLTEPDVVWERGGRYWRFREAHEEGSGRQVNG